MIETAQRVLGMFVSLFAGIPPLVSALVFLVLLSVTLWVAHAAWHSYRVLDAVANAPLADLRSNAGGLVKLRGTAQPPPARDGYSPSSIVWHKKHSRWGTSSSTTVTVGHFLIEDEHGVCAVDSEQAEVIPTTHESSRGFLGSSRSTTEQSIHTGDALLAIGELRRDLPAPPGMADVRCQLVRTGGVLLVSGDAERGVKVRYGIWLGVQLVPTLLGLGLLALGALVHASKEDNAAGRFLHALLSTEYLEPTIEEAQGKLLAISAPYGLQLTAPPVADYAAQGWSAITVGEISMFVPPGWTVVEQDHGASPEIGLAAPGNDGYIELRFIRDALRRPGIALEEAGSNYASAKERAEKGIVLGYAPLIVDGAVGHIEIMNSGGVEKNADGSLAHRMNRYQGAKRVGEELFSAEFRARFDQSGQDKFGPIILNIIRSIQFKN